MTDESPMPFGKYKGEPLEDVPASYLLWLHAQGLDKGPLKEYIEENMDALDKEASENQNL